MEEVNAPINDHEIKPISKSKFGWTIIVFLIALVFLGALTVWQLFGISPQDWCNIAEDSSDNVRGACLSVLLKLLDVKDHAIIGLITILGITVLSVVAVALNVRISAAGPGNTNVNIGADEANINGDNVNVTVPNPVTEDKK